MRGTTLINLRRALEGRLKSDEREGGVAMLTAILFIIIMAGVSTIILGVVTSQTIPSYIDQKGTKTIYSAQAGVQAALALMRSAGTLDVTNTLYGDTTKLPCSLTGTTNSITDGNSYTVTINYFTLNPSGQDATWIAANKLVCNSTTYGVTGNGPVGTPKYALITGQGLASQIPVVSTQANRSITALYTFKVSNVNILGGLINNNGATACMQAVSATAGSKITFVAAASCSPTGANSALQLWSYTNNWQIALSGTTAGGAAGLCITGPVAAGQATQNALLQPCLGTSDPARWNQLWSWTGSYTWEGESQAINGPNGSSWLSTGVADGTSPVGKFLQVATSTNGTMAPTAQVGAGAAGYTKHHLVNYLEFGRCADVTNENLASTAMIAYPCKQDPTGGTSYITWNQKWYYCEPGDITSTCAGVNTAAQQIYIYYGDNVAQKYCLTTPLTNAGNFFPYFTTCALTGTLASQQTWNRVFKADTYLASYLFVDTYGRCLMSNSANVFSGDIHEMTSTTCNGSDAQKWNAPPTYVDSSVGGYREISGG